MIDIEGIAKILASETKHDAGDWQECLSEAIHDPAFSSMTDGDIDQLSKSLQSPDQLKWLIECFRNARFRLRQETAYDYVSKHVSISAFTLGDWLSALHFVGLQASSENKNCNLEVLVEFVLGCAQAQVPPKDTLLVIVQSTIAKQGL